MRSVVQRSAAHWHPSRRARRPILRLTLPPELARQEEAMCRQHGLRLPSRRLRAQATHEGVWCWLCRHTLYDCQCPLEHMRLWG